ncbi:MAG: arginine--tRNA ligase [Dehalococcoidia bacterium]|nr:arginine--tRNA ligase [Dehalococcoidia bacterium]
MVRVKLAEALQRAIEAAQKADQIAFTTLPDIVIERPQDPTHGDFASGIALRLARSVRMNPLQLAQVIVDKLEPMSEIDSVNIAAPGFINFELKQNWLTGLVNTIVESPDTYGNTKTASGEKVQIEFVSANPTGPLHVGHGRGAVLGSTLANVLVAAGYVVEREYYLNDTGNQIRTFGRSLYARYRQQLGDAVEVASDGYMGDYVVDLARAIVETHGRQFADMPEQEAAQALADIATVTLTEGIRKDLLSLNVEFDNWFSEKSLYASGEYQHVMDILRERGYIAEREGAIWFESSLLGEDKDNVLVRTDKTPTYFASDVAYHYDKLVKRGFDRVIDIWGADHQGHIPRMKAVVKTLGKDPEQLTVLTCQLVTLRRGKEIVRASKRSGDVVALGELVEEVGADACRYIFLSRSADSQMDFDIELATKQSADNPVYYVQYAYARIASILRNAKERGLSEEPGNPDLLTDEAELALLRVLSRLPEIVDEVARTLEPHHLPHYAQELATAFHAFYKQCRVLSDNAELTQARIGLAKATKIVLARTLALMGVSAPEQM